MSNCSRSNLALALVAVLLGLAYAQLTVPSAHAQQPVHAAASTAIPRTADGHPDLTGVWWLGRDVPVQTLRVGSPRAAGAQSQRRETFSSYYQPWARDKAKTLSDKDDPALHCIPVAFGTSNVSLAGLGFVGQIVQNPKFMVMLTETYHNFKAIPTDGRKHRDDVPASYRGDSVGHWEGDTFVVDTTNFNDRNWMHAEGSDANLRARAVRSTDGSDVHQHRNGVVDGGRIEGRLRP